MKMKIYIAEFKREYNRSKNKHEWICKNIFDNKGKSVWINGWIDLGKKNIQWLMNNNPIVFKIIPKSKLPKIRRIDDEHSVIETVELNLNFEKFEVFGGKEYV